MPRLTGEWMRSRTGRFHTTTPRRPGITTTFWPTAMVCSWAARRTRSSPPSGKLPYVDKINSMPKYVASTTLRDLQWENSRLIEGDVAEGVATLKQQPGQDLVVYGGQDLTHSLLEHDLVDEYRILVSPVLLGRGRCLHKDGARRVNLKLVDTTVIPPGVAVLTYQPTR